MSDEAKKPPKRVAQVQVRYDDGTVQAYVGVGSLKVVHTAIKQDKGPAEPVSYIELTMKVARGEREAIKQIEATL